MSTNLPMYPYLHLPVPRGVPIYQEPHQDPAVCSTFNKWRNCKNILRTRQPWAWGCLHHPARLLLARNGQCDPAPFEGMLKLLREKQTSRTPAGPWCNQTNYRVHMDLFGFRNISEKGKQELLCITDAFSHNVELVALPNNN